MDPTEPTPEMDALVEQLNDACQKIGLYLRDAQILTPSDPAHEAFGAVPDIAKAIKDDETQVVLVGTFILGAQAFSKRVLQPDQYEVDKTVQVMLPDPAEERKAKIEQALKEGKGLDGIFDEEL